MSRVLLTGGDVQALVEDDPIYLNQILRFSPQRLEWLFATGTAPVQYQTDQCETPQLTPTLGSLSEALSGRTQNNGIKGLSIADINRPAYVIQCRHGLWGPEPKGASLSMTQGGELLVTWYDNALLMLSPLR